MEVAVSDREQVDSEREKVKRERNRRDTNTKRQQTHAVLCFWKMHDNRDAIIRWEGQVEDFKGSASYK